MPHVNNNGVRIEYELLGQGEPLVLIHGWSCEGRYWREFGYVAKLSEEFTVIIPDLRGHGRSDKPRNGDFTDAAFASDVVAVLDDAGIDSAHVFGYSLGGWVVFELIANHSARIKTPITTAANRRSTARRGQSRRFRRPDNSTSRPHLPQVVARALSPAKPRQLGHLM